MKIMHRKLLIAFSVVVIALPLVAVFLAWRTRTADTHNNTQAVVSENSMALAESPFVNIQPDYPFYSDIVWLYEQGITNGSVQPDGTVVFAPQDPVSREAMAAFLYRLAGKPTFTPPEVSTIIDVAADAVFYKEIAWLIDAGISNGDTFNPSAGMTREVTAAFLYRFAGSPVFTPPSISPFSDVSTSHAFYREITWMAASGISTGSTQADGTRTFSPQDLVSREATAAFLHRTVAAGLI